MLIFYRFEPDDAYKKNAYIKKSMYYVEKMTNSTPTTFIGITYATSIPTTVVGMLVEPL